MKLNGKVTFPGQILDVLKISRLHAYLWQQRCYWTESGPACRGPDTPLLCFCSCLGHLLPSSLRACRLYNRWKMLDEVFRTGPMCPGAQKPWFGFGWTKILVAPPGPGKNLPERTEKKDPAVKVLDAWIRRHKTLNVNSRSDKNLSTRIFVSFVLFLNQSLPLS